MADRTVRRDPTVPPEIETLVSARSRARASHDWAEADRLRGEIESAGWRVVDQGVAVRLEPAYAADLVVDGETRFGRSTSVPSRLDEPASGSATAVLVSSGRPDPLERVVRGLRDAGPADLNVIIIADDPDTALAARLDRWRSAPSTLGERVEVLRTAVPLGYAAGANGGIRRAVAPVVVLLDPDLEPTGDVVGPLIAALADPTVAVAGGWGSVTGDLRRDDRMVAGDVDAVGGACLAFRRADYVARGPLDERFRGHRYLGIWWSLVLRDEGTERPPRRAVHVPGLPLVGAGTDDAAEMTGGRDREARRDFYRIIGRFGARRDLLTRAGRP